MTGNIVFSSDRLALPKDKASQLDHRNVVNILGLVALASLYSSPTPTAYQSHTTLPHCFNSFRNQDPWASIGGLQCASYPHILILICGPTLTLGLAIWLALANGTFKRNANRGQINTCTLELSLLKCSLWEPVGAQEGQTRQVNNEKSHGERGRAILSSHMKDLK